MRDEQAILDGADDMRAELDAHRPLTPEIQERLTTWLLPRFIYCSVGLGEENPLSGPETATFLESEIVSGGHHIEKFLAVARHRRAFETVEQRAKEGGEIDLPFLRMLHRSLVGSSSLLNKEARPGLFKVEPSRPTRRRGHLFEYSLPVDTEQQMTELLDGFRIRRKEDHPLKAVTWFMFHFHLIHPFQSANGEVGRLVAACVLMNHGYPPLIMAPDTVGEYMDALMAVHLTVPRDERRALAPQFDVSTLLEFFANCVTRTGERMLDIVSGRTLSSHSFAATVGRSQDRMLTQFLGQKNLSWRVRATQEIRTLHGRVAKVAKRLAVDGSLYNVVLTRSEVVPSHACDTALVPALPTAEAGLVGEVAFQLEGEPTMRGLKYPEVCMFLVGIVSTSIGLHIITTRRGMRPRTHTGPPRSPEWPTQVLESIVTKALDQERKVFEQELDSLNTSTSGRYRLIRERLRAEAADGQPEELPVDESSDMIAGLPKMAQEGPRTAREQREQRTASRRLDGLRPSEPPLNF